VVRRVQAGSLAFSFCRADAAASVAETDFALALRQVTARSALLAGLAEATARFQQSLSEADFEAQQSLRKDMESLDAAMMKLVESRRED
jgi:DNA primase